MQGESVREEGEGRRGRRGSAFIPGLKTGDFPLRPLHPRKLKKTCTKPNEPLEGFEPPIC